MLYNNIMTRINSLTTQLDLNILANENAIELLTKIDEAINTDTDTVTASVTDLTTGQKINRNIITFKALKSEINSIKNLLNTLIGIDGTGATIATAKNEYKRIFLQDTNVEPTPISTLNEITTFKADRNWFLDSMLDPLLSVEFNLSDKIQEPIRKVLSRRFILNFDNDNVNLASFNLNFKNKSNIDINVFVTWLDDNNISYEIDEQIFDLNSGRLQKRGSFDVISTETDNINNKFWFILNTLNYLDVTDINNPVQKSLVVGDTLKVNSINGKSTASTIYTVDEINTSSSLIKVRLSRRLGIEPIPIKVNSLSIDSPVIDNKKLKVTVSYDEYNVIFLKPVNSVNNVSSNNWSLGTAFYTPELKLNTSNGQSLKDYYITNVYDYSLILKDLVAKKIPTSNGVKPNSPKIVLDNFKVVQINKHLTDTSDSENLRNLHNKKNTLKSELDQINESILKQQKILNSTTFRTENDKKQVENELNNLISKKEITTTQLQSTIGEILTNKKNINSISPKYRLRGFWPMPDSVQGFNSQPQEVVQFEIYYRYANKNGSLSSIDTFKVGDETNTSAAFSPWIVLKTDARKRYYDDTDGVWKWEIENVSDADTPNINQIDIPIEVNEQIQFKIRSISEVGWPDTLLYSDFTDVLTFNFPEDLSLILSEDSFVLKEASEDDLIVKFRKDLNASGITKHIETGFNEGDKYWPHEAANISSGMRDNSGKLIDLFTKITQMQAEINSLNEKLNRARGELRLTLLRNNSSTIIYNDQNLEININLENFGIKAQGGTVDAPVNLPINRSYINDISLFKDYTIRIDNAATSSPLSILSNRIYTTTGLNNTSFALESAKPQATWIDSNNIILLNGSTVSSDLIKTQLDNQFVWLQYKRSDGSEIYAHSTDLKYTYSVLNSNDKNFGINQNMTMITGSEYFNGVDSILKLTDSVRWKRYNNTLNNSGVLATLHPSIQSLKNIQELSSDKVKILNPGIQGTIDIPLNLYWKFTGENNLLSNLLTSNSYYFETAKFQENEVKKNTILQSILFNFGITSITKGIATVLSFTKSSGYSNVTNATLTRVYSVDGSSGTPGGIPNMTITTSSGEILTCTQTISGTYTACKVGDIFSVSGGSNGRVIITDISSDNTNAKFAPIRIGLLQDMGLSSSDMLMIDEVTAGVNETITNINNKYVRITNIDTVNNTITINYNSNNLTGTPNGGRISLLTDITSIKTVNSTSVLQVWNSIGRDNTQNKPINESIFVVNDTLNRNSSDTIKRTVRFYIEPEMLGRPFQFSITFNIKQFNDTLSSAPTNIPAINNNNNTIIQ